MYQNEAYFQHLSRTVSAEDFYFCFYEIAERIRRDLLWTAQDLPEKMQRFLSWISDLAKSAEKNELSLLTFGYDKQKDFFQGLYEDGFVPYDFQAFADAVLNIEDRPEEMTEHDYFQFAVSVYERAYFQLGREALGKQQTVICIEEDSGTPVSLRKRFLLSPDEHDSRADAYRNIVWESERKGILYGPDGKERGTAFVTEVGTKRFREFTCGLPDASYGVATVLAVEECSEDYIDWIKKLVPPYELQCRGGEYGLLLAYFPVEDLYRLIFNNPMEPYDFKIAFNSLSEEERDDFAMATADLLRTWEDKLHFIDLSVIRDHTGVDLEEKENEEDTER